MLDSLLNNIKKTRQHRCFPLKSPKFLRTPFSQNTFGGCFSQFEIITVIVIILTGTSQSESIITITITLDRRKNPSSNFKNTKSNEGSYIDSILNLRIVNNNRKTAFLEKKNYFKFSWLMQKQRFSIEVYVTFNFRKTQSMFESHYSTSNSQLNLYHMQKQ